MTNKILYMSDLHIRRPNDNAYYSLKKSIKSEVDLDSVEAVIVGGDLADFKNGFYHLIDDLVTDLFPTCPVGVLAGNHDVWRQYWDSAMTSDYIFFVEMKRICNMFGNVVWLEEEVIKLGSWLLSGSIAWYDYSSKREGPGYISTLPDQYFHHNRDQFTRDGSCIAFSKTDQQLSQELRDNLTNRIDKNINEPGIENLAVFTHVPLFKEAIQWKDQSWNHGCQYFYNLTLGDRVRQYDKLQLVVSGHTHYGVEQLSPRAGGEFQHLVSYADYGYPEAFIIELEDDGSCSYRRIGMYNKMNFNN